MNQWPELSYITQSLADSPFHLVRVILSRSVERTAEYVRLD